jgi:hypothetical protein
MALAPALLAAAPVYVNQAIEDGGSNFPEAGRVWLVDDVGWIYRPSSTIHFSRLSTIFDSSDGRLITVEIWTNLPADLLSTPPPPNTWSGMRAPASTAALLATTSFLAGAGTYGGGTANFGTDVVLQAGQDYFIGYRNMNGMGANWTGFVAATEFLLMRYDEDDSGNYQQKPPCTGGTPNACEPFNDSYVILRFDTPEPGVNLLIGTGLLGLAALRRRRGAAR